MLASRSLRRVSAQQLRLLQENIPALLHVTRREAQNRFVKRDKPAERKMRKNMRSIGSYRNKNNLNEERVDAEDSPY